MKYSIECNITSPRSVRRRVCSVPPRELVVRPMRSDDRTDVAALLARLTPESLFQRFHSGGVNVDEAVLDAATAGRALVAEVDGRLVGLASYVWSARRTAAEGSIVVDDAAQRRGIGTALWRELVRDAERTGLHSLMATIMRSNYAMLRLLRGLDRPVHQIDDGPVLQVNIQLSTGM